MTIQRIFTTFVIFASAHCYADTKVTARYTAEGKTTETTTYSKGQRLRYQYGPELTLVRDCGQKQIHQIDDKTKTVVNLPVDDKATQAAKPTITDTGETKPAFGHTAHHLKMTQPADNGLGRVEIDGWYIDLKDMPACATDPNQKPAGMNAALPVSYTVTTYRDGMPPVANVSMEVTELVENPLDASMFEVPHGYTASGSSATPAAKAPGAIRVGAAVMQNKSGQKAVHTSSYEHLMAQLRQAKIDVVALPGGASEATAAQMQCDYVLYTEVDSVEKPAAAKVSGFLKRAPGIGRGAGGDDAFEAKVSYRLVPAAGGAPVLSATAVGKTGSAFSWKTAVSIASSVTPMMMMTRMYGGGAFGPGMMNMLVTGHAYGPMMGLDPMMNSMSMVARAGSMAAGPATNPTAADHAIAAALDQEAKAVAAQVNKR